jgi:excinuclease ABC subunit B
MPNSDTYIEKEAQINDEIDRLRHAATQALLSRRDVIIVASVSCIYGLGSAEEYQKAIIVFRQGEQSKREEVLEHLVFLQYERNDLELKRGTFRVRGEIIEIMPTSIEQIVRISLSGDIVEKIDEINPVTGQVVRSVRFSVIYPARHFVTPPEQIESALNSIKHELDEQLKVMDAQKKLLEFERLKRRTTYDMEMIKEVGYCTGIENYSRHFDGRAPGQAPNTLLDYFPKDFLLVIDESHVTVPQINGMYNGDKARKDILVEHGFRLPSARDNRPLKFD